MKIAVLWTGLSGYFNACLKELASRDGVSLFVSYQLPRQEAPFDNGQFSWIPESFAWRSESDLRNLNVSVRDFAPDILFFASWHIPAYRQTARSLRGRCWRVMGMDNPWVGSARQRFGTFISPYWVMPIADAVWLPGEKQAQFARKLGFSQKTILRGLYCCDQASFEAVHAGRLRDHAPVPRRFLFVGRMVAEKCVDRLSRAYVAYRKICDAPWPLVACGAGPLRSRLEKQEGITVQGFVQPENMARIFAETGCLILPSRFDPWGLVVHEATSAGRLVLTSENVGAAASLVQPGYNGFIFDDNDSDLAFLLARVSRMSDEQLDEMSCASYALSRQFSPARWADTLLSAFTSRHN